ncbi:hypothetical protein, partial [Cronobacter sakazakii]|uniref:hypothetical protein n=1 Tax=Cronobacter sakazakii TaxID=28141 RepID=UPI001F2AE738
KMMYLHLVPRILHHMKNKCTLVSVSVPELSLEPKQVERARAYSVNFRTAERFGLLHIVEKPVVFWFEQYNEQKQNE